MSFENYENGRWPVPDPVRERPQVRPQDSASGIGYYFAFDVGTRATDRTAWLDAEEDLRLVVQLSDGAKRHGAEILRLVALLDGVQVPLLHHTEEFTAPWFPLAEDGTGDESFAIDAARFTQGAHTLALMLISARTGAIVVSNLKTIILGEGGFGARADYAAQAKRYPSEGLVPAPFSGDVWLVGPQARELFQRDGDPLPLRIFAESIETVQGRRCDDLRVPLLVTALVDGQQLELGEFGPFIRVVPEYNELLVFDTELRNVPDDDAPHALTVVLVQGDGLYTESAPGKLVPWYGPVVELTSVWWE